MDNKIKQSFDAIKADDKLKEQTMIYLNNVIDNQNRRRKKISYYRFAPAAACIIFFICIGLFSHNIYYTPVSYVSLDVNPSIEITLNRFDKVIETTAFNTEGKTILSALQLKNYNYNDAVKAIVDSITEQGYIADSGLVAVTLQTNLADKESKMRTTLEEGVLSVISGHHLTAQIEVISVDSQTVSDAHAQDLSPAKYLAIMKLIESDPSVSFESCRDHSIGELRELTESHHDDDTPQSEHQNQHGNDH